MKTDNRKILFFCIALALSGSLVLLYFSASAGPIAIRPAEISEEDYGRKIITSGIVRYASQKSFLVCSGKYCVRVLMRNTFTNGTRIVIEGRVSNDRLIIAEGADET